MNDRMREEIDNMMQNITFDPAMMQRTRTKSRGHSITHAAKRALALAVAAAILTTGAFALGVSLLQHIRNQMGSFGSQVVPVITANEAQDQGLKVSVVGSMSDSYNTKVYLAIQDTTGDRLDENTKLEAFCEAKEKGQNASIIGVVYPPKQISYDKETKTALFEMRAERRDLATETNGQHTLKIAIKSIQPGYYDAYWSDNESLHCTVKGVKNYTIALDGDMPVPEQNPRTLEGMNGIRLSSMGFDENNIFHTMFEIPEGIYFRQRDKVTPEGTPTGEKYLKDMIITNLSSMDSHRFTNEAMVSHETKHILSDDGRYMDFQVPYYKREAMPEEVTLQISASYVTKPEIKGKWNLETTIETTPEYTLSKPVQLLENCMVTEARLSPIGLYVEYTNVKCLLTPAVITMKDGTTYRYDEEQTGNAINGMFTGDGICKWYLDFAENEYANIKNPLNQPLDITQVDKVTINGVEIPFDR